MSTSTAPPARRSALGLPMVTSLVVGSMVGSGVFLLPASLAPFGGASLVGWLITTAGSILVGLVFARLARRLPAVGGPYAYTDQAFGELPGFLVGWGYWISCWSATAAIAVAMTGYLGDLVPSLTRTPAAAAGATIAAILLLTAVNIAGVRQAGWVQLATTVLKVLPLVAIALFGLPRLVPEHFVPFNPTDGSAFAAVQACIALTLWAFLGLEAGTVPAADIRDPERTIPRATVLGVVIAAVLYIASTVAVMGMVPPESLGTSPAPFAEAARVLWGAGAGRLVAIGAFISCFGALNGWILVTGQMPAAIARRRLFPPAFARLSRHGTPAFGLAVGGLLASVLVAANFTKGLVGMFTAMILLSTLAAVIPYAFCTMAEAMLSIRDRRADARRTLGGALTLSLLAFVYSLVAIAGTGQETVFWGLLALLSGLPVYVLMKWRLPDPG